VNKEDLDRDQSIKVLLIADDSPFLRAVTEFLHRRQMVEARSMFFPEKILSGKFPTVHPQVILLDLDMAAHHGLETITLLRKTLPETPIVALSFYSSRGLQRATTSAGAMELIEKNSLSTDLMPAIFRAVEESQPKSRKQEHPLNGSTSWNGVTSE
jgi:DNA-binding NarL/FixJ family response regulator